jgi:protein-tyrosine phosphatase
LNQYWWHSITDKLILGGIPLLNFDHVNGMKKLGVQAVYSILEDFEALSNTFFSVPVIAENWKRADIAYQRLRCPDMKAMTVKELSLAADWVHSHISSNKTVYVHCKAGRGRSVMVAMAYLIRYHKKSLKQALEHICSKRSVVSLRPCQLDRLKEFALYHL